MTEFDSKIVSFERNAKYLHERAIKNKKSGRGTDALDLLRRAVEREPENMRYRLDLAILLSEMGLFEQASMAIENAMLLNHAPVECLYAMGVILFQKGDISKAERIIRAYTDAQDTERGAEAKRLLDEIAIAKEGFRPDRKTLRAMRCADKACRMMTSGNHAGAERMFSLSMRMNDSAPEVHALRGMNKHMWGKEEEAYRELAYAFDRADEFESGKARVCAVAAQVFSSAGDQNLAQGTILEALKEDVQGNDLRMLLSAMYDTGYHEKIHEYVPKALNDAPYDKSLLHALSVSAYCLGLEREEVLSGWRKIERIDPFDPVCKYFIRLIESEEKCELSYAYCFPSGEAMNRANALMNAVFKGEEFLTETWEKDETFRNIVNWEIYQPDSRFTRLALSCMMAIRSEETDRRIRVFLERPDLPMDVRAFIRQGRELMARPLPIDLSEEYIHAGMPTEEELMSRFSVGEKQMVRYAAEYVEEKYRDYPVADIALIWSEFKKRRGSHGVRMVSTEAGSAALAMSYLNMTGKMEDIFTVSKWYGCSSRQAAYVARLMRNCISHE